MQSLMGETTAVAHGGDPQDRAASPRPRCIASDAEGHLRRLRQLMPDLKFVIIFDTGEELDKK
nr:hypothetical protein [Moorena producens]